jgi:antibiotic biosynthesis monooxygenase (ABM) superfamily enzyme
MCLQRRQALLERSSKKFEVGVRLVMYALKEVVTVTAGLLFSFALAVLLEELFFGGLFRFVLAPRLERSRKQWQSGRQD